MLLVCSAGARRGLQRRWVSADMASIDGAYKFNVLGWPLHLLGVCDKSNQLDKATKHIW